MTNVRRVAPYVLVLLGAVYVACVGFGVQTMGDYGPDFAPSMAALLGGHLHAFFVQLPTDGAGGSILLRAPAALIAKALGGGELTIFRAGALECVLALAGLGLWLARGMRAQPAPPLARAAVIGLLTLLPLVTGVILFGHPEEALGAALCVAAVLLAGEDRATLSAIALGLAAINKPWGVIAVVPALAAAPREHRIRMVAIAAAIAGPWLAATAVVAPAAFSRQLGAVWPVAHPVDIWWPLASPSVTPGGMHEYLTTSFLARHGRDLVVIVPVACSLALARRCEGSTEAGLRLLALAFLLRCLVDPSDHFYYHLPFLAALVAWESRTRGAPALALLATGLLWFVFHTVAGVASLDVQFVAYLAVTLPLAAFLLVPLMPSTALGARAAIVRAR
jgi:hypothetical protein